LVEKDGYKLHHTKYVRGVPQLVLTKWLDESRPNMLPHYSSHTLGVGGVVIHPDQDKVLLIKEKFVSTGF